jgi:hypothetical protein
MKEVQATPDLVFLQKKNNPHAICDRTPSNKLARGA